MDYIENFSKYNQKNKLDAKSYVDNNIGVLIQLMNIEEEDYDSIDDIKDVLIEYYTKHPDEISSVSLSTFGVPKNYAVRLNNIGGVVKYK
jgi:hypothetical protein